MSEKCDRGEASLLTTIEVIFIGFELLVYMTLLCVCINIELAV